MGEGGYVPECVIAIFSNVLPNDVMSRQSLIDRWGGGLRARGTSVLFIVRVRTFRPDN